MKKIIAVARKEVYHILRDRRSLAVVFLLPLVMLLIFGYAIDMELRDLPVAILDGDRTPASRSFVRDLTASGFIVAAAQLSSREEVEPGFRQRRFRAVIVIPAGYARSLARGEEARVQVLIDGADGSTAATVDNYLDAAILLVNRRARGEVALGGGLLPVEPEGRVYFNPELKSDFFIIPGLAAIVMTMISALLTSLALTREKETGTMEQVLTTPVAPGQVLVGKLVPYLVVAFLDASLVIAAGRLVFHVPMHGSWLVLGLYSLLYLIIALALGLLISTIVATQRVAMMAALAITMLPVIMLSGFVFPPASMPLALRILSQMIPATHYLTVIRGIMLKGQSWFPFETGAILLLGMALMGVAVRRFRVTLD